MTDERLAMIAEQAQANVGQRILVVTDKAETARETCIAVRRLLPTATLTHAYAYELRLANGANIVFKTPHSLRGVRADYAWVLNYIGVEALEEVHSRSTVTVS